MVEVVVVPAGVDGEHVLAHLLNGAVDGVPRPAGVFFDFPFGDEVFDDGLADLGVDNDGLGLFAEVRSEDGLKSVRGRLGVR